MGSEFAEQNQSCSVTAYSQHSQGCHGQVPADEWVAADPSPHPENNHVMRCKLLFNDIKLQSSVCACVCACVCVCLRMCMHA